MRGNKNYYFLILLYFLNLHILHSRSCTHKCGDIQIPFPFGIGEKGCYLDEWYQVECLPNAISRKVFPFLPKLNMEVVNISLPGAKYDIFSRYRLFSSIRVKSPITSVGCSGDGEEFGSTLNLTDTPFFFGDENNLVAVGCNIKAWLTNVEPRIVGCQSTCTSRNNSHSIPFFDQVGCSSSPYSVDQGILPNNYIPVCNTTLKKEDTCNGNGCCQAKGPVGAAQQLIGVTITNSNGTMTTGGGCRVAFLTDEVYTISNATNPKLFFSKGYATVSLGWFIQTKSPSFLQSLDCQNREELDQRKRFSINSTAKCTCDGRKISGISYASCACVWGYRGNPYLFEDCKGKQLFPSFFRTCLTSCEFYRAYMPG